MMRHIHPRKQTDYIGKNLIKAKTITTATSEKCRIVCRPGSVKIFKEQKPDFYDNGSRISKKQIATYNCPYNLASKDYRQGIVIFKLRV